MFYLFIQHIINTIGTIDYLIEKYGEIIDKLEQIILLKYDSDIQKESKSYKLKEIIDVIDNRGKTPPLVIDKKEHPIVEVAQLTTSNMLIDFASFEKYVSEETYQTFFRNGHLAKDDVLVSTVGTIGVAAYNFESGLSIAQNVVALRSKYSHYIYCYLIKNKKEILNLDIGGVQPSIKIPHLLNLEIQIPTINEKDFYINLFDEINQLNKKKIILNGIKKKYLNKYFG